MGGGGVAGRAGGENSDASTTSMTEAEALGVLGLAQLGAFEEVVSAKNRLLARHRNDDPRVVEIEAAYDCLLMSSMKKRISGESYVPGSVRFADVSIDLPAKQIQAFSQKLLGGGVGIGAKSSIPLETNSIIFLSLAFWALFQGINLPEGVSGDLVPGFPLACAAVWSIYSLRENRQMGLGKAAAYTVVALIIGAIAGGIIEGFVRIDENPLGLLHSPTTFVSEFALLSLWVSATFFA